MRDDTSVSKHSEPTFIPAETIKEILMRRDGMSEYEADDLIEEAKESLQRCIDDGDIYSAEQICQEYFSLEPDYLDELY